MFNSVPRRLTPKNYGKVALLYRERNGALQRALKEKDQAEERGEKERRVRKIEKRIDRLFRDRGRVEDLFNRPEIGLFVGMGINLDDPEKEVRPKYNKWGNTINHTNYYGTTRRGKSYGMASAMRQYILDGGATGVGQNAIIIDPKGGERQEILGWSMQFAGEAGRPRDLFYINPMYPELSQFINPLFGMSNEEISSTVALLSQGGGATVTGDGQVFAAFAYKVVLAETTALEFLEKALSRPGAIQKAVEDEVQKYKDLSFKRGLDITDYDEVNNLLTPDFAERAAADIHQNRGAAVEPLLFTRTLITFRELAHYCQFENLQQLHKSVKMADIDQGHPEAGRLAGLKREAEALLQEITVKNKDFYDKIVMALSTLLIQLSVGRIGEVFCTVRINPLVARLVSQDRGLIAVLQPTPLKFQQTSEMLLKVFMKMLESVFGTVGASGRGLRRRTTMFIDEGKAAIFPGIEEIYNKASGLGLSIVAFYQSPKDIESKVGRELAKVIMDNVNTEFFMKVNDFESRRAIAMAIGSAKRIGMMYMSSSGGDARGTTVSEDRDIITPDMILKLPVASAYMLHDGERWRVNFPYQTPPKAALKMPKLKEEELYRVVNNMEAAIDRARAEGDMIAHRPDAPSSKLELAS